MKYYKIEVESFYDDKNEIYYFKKLENAIVQLKQIIKDGNNIKEDIISAEKHIKNIENKKTSFPEYLYLYLTQQCVVLCECNIKFLDKD